MIQVYLSIIFFILSILYIIYCFRTEKALLLYIDLTMETFRKIKDPDECLRYQLDNIPSIHSMVFSFKYIERESFLSKEVLEFLEGE